VKISRLQNSHFFVSCHIFRHKEKITYLITRLVESGAIKRTSGRGGNSKCTYKRSEIDMALTAKKLCKGWGERGIKKAIINSNNTNYKVLI